MAVKGNMSRQLDAGERLAFAAWLAVEMAGKRGVVNSFPCRFDVLAQMIKDSHVPDTTEKLRYNILFEDAVDQAHFVLKWG